MKVNGTGSMGSAATPGTGKPAAAGGFSVPQAGGAGGVARSAGVAGVGSVEALIALQQVESPTERRRRAVKRGGRLLDLLDDVRLSLLAGSDAQAAAGRLAAISRETREATDDARLDGVLREIDTRAAVELAKLEMSRRPTSRAA